MKIWVLFSVQCEHDQPAHNMVGWWLNKPTVDQIQKLTHTNNNDGWIETLLEVEGRQIQDPYDLVGYTLTEVPEGTSPWDSPPYQGLTRW